MALFVKITAHLSIAAYFIAMTLSQTSNGPSVDVNYAMYRGHYNDSLSINEYRGIRFAEPPIASLRWKAPLPYAPRNLTKSVFNATQSGAPCVQGYPKWILSGRFQHSGSEDCLFLDVFVPANATKGSDLPVAVAIPGGGYVMGYTSQSSPYALMRHSQNSFIFVNIQYRLGAYGFLGSDRFTKDGGATNAGLLDQRLALEWVKKNIKCFGGDQSKITILGGSAGGGSVTSHLIWQRGIATPPFRAAMADFPWWQQYSSQVQLAKQYDGLLDAANCSTLMCLRALPEDTLKEATQATYISAYECKEYGYGNFYYGPYVDGKMILGLPSQEFSAGRFAKVPTWISREGYEGFTFSNQSVTTIEEETEDLGVHFPYANQTFLDDVFDLYPRD